MFQSLTILRELVQSLAKVIFLLKHSVKLRHCILCGDVAACHGTACVPLVVQTDRQPVAQSDVAIKSRNVLNCQTSQSSSQHSCFAFSRPTLQAVQTVHVQWISSVPPSKSGIVPQIRLGTLKFTIHQSDYHSELFIVQATDGTDKQVICE